MVLPTTGSLTPLSQTYPPDNIGQAKVNPGLFHKLSSSASPLAVIETARFLAIVGLVCSVFTSVLLPSLAFATIATIACVLKNRVTQIERVAKSFSIRPPSIMKQISHRSTNDPVKPTGSPIIAEQESQETTSIKTFLESLKPNLKSLQQQYEVLTICYLYLYNKQDIMPKDLNKPWKNRFWNFISQKTEAHNYLAEKYNRFLDKTSENFKQSIVEDDQGNKILKIENIEEDPWKAANSLIIKIQDAPASLIMEIVGALHEGIGKELRRYQDEGRAKHHDLNAVHTKAYIQQLKDFEENLLKEKR